MYVICDRKKGNQIIQEKIKGITKRLVETFTSLDRPDLSETLQAKELKEFIRKEFKDLIIKPEERARKLFG